jgi:release factor glutamine methyltransferase
MTTGECITKATKELSKAGIQTARLDVLVLLSDIFKQDKAAILAHPERILNDRDLAMLRAQIDQRITHTPLAYIRGKAMFYGREFTVTPAVLVPRPETEAIIELLMSLPISSSAKIADIGTGSGCIGLTAALELPEAHVDLYDIDDDALKVATRNRAKLGASANVAKSNILADITDSYDVLLANLPYVPNLFPINEAAKQEPALALFSGADGLDHYRTFWTQVASLTSKPTYVITESLPSQHHALATLARHAGYYLEETQDFIQRFVAL